MRAGSCFVLLFFLYCSGCTDAYADLSSCEQDSQLEASMLASAYPAAKAEENAQGTRMLFGTVEYNGEPRVSEFLQAISVEYGLP